MLRISRFSLCVLTFVLLSGCLQKPSGDGTVRLAIFPADVLIADPAAEWVRVALPLVLEEDLATSRSIVTFFASGGSATYAGQASEALRTIVEDRDGKTKLSAAITDLSTQKNRESIDVESRASAEILPAINRLAKQIDSSASAFPTSSLPALKSFTAAVLTQNPAQRLQLLNEAVSADASFGLAHIALAETASQTSPQNLPAIVAAGAAQHEHFAPLERARWNLLAARYQHSPLQQQADLAAAILHIAANYPDALVTLGTDRFLQGNAAEGERYLRRAIAVTPGNLNLQIQFAAGLVESKKFSEAIRVLRPLSGNAAAIPSLATALLLDGKANEANDTFESLTQFVPPDGPQYRFLQDQWQAVSARNKAGMDLPDTPAMAGYRAFLNGRFDEAVPFWRNVVQQTGDTDLRARTMLAASLKGAGQNAEAEKIAVLPFVPDLSDAGIAIAFQQMRQLLRL